MKNKILPIMLKDLEVRLPEPGGSLVILQRNAQKSTAGHIISGAGKQVQKMTKTIVTNLLKPLSDSDRSSVDFLVIGSDPRIGANNEVHLESLATLETAQEVLKGLREVLQSFNMKDLQLINTSAVPGGGVVEISEIKSWLPIKDSLELMEFIEKKAVQTGEDIKYLYEIDAYKEEREKLGVEGAKEVAERMGHLMSSVRGLANYHAAHPGRRLIFWVVTRFDIATPYVRTILAHPAECNEIIPVENLGGIILNIKPDHTATVVVRNKEYATNLYYSIVTG